MATGEIFGSLCDFDLEISMLSLSTLIGFLLDIIFKCLNLLLKPIEPNVFPAMLKTLGKQSEKIPVLTFSTPEHSQMCYSFQK